MSFWTSTSRDDTPGLDYGSMHLNESPSLYMIHSAAPASSAQTQAEHWLQQCYESNSISLREYETRVEKLRRAVRLGIDSGDTCTDRIPTILRQLNSRWHLISVDCDHFSSEAWEESFACCYRNAQCILSSLFRRSDFRKRLFGALSAMPSLWKLQALMETAWSLGFDSLGASQLSEMLRTSGRRLAAGAHQLHPAEDTRNLVGLVDSTAWLGATDLASLFGSIGVRCSVLECQAPSGPNGTHPRLLEHIYSYIQVGRVTETASGAFSVPMLLQHAGHSRVVIGVETDESGEPVALILLDPNIPSETMSEIMCAASNRQTTTISGYDWIELVRVDISELTHPQYQLLQVNGLVETESELQDAMTPENITIVVS